MKHIRSFFILGIAALAIDTVGQDITVQGNMPELRKFFSGESDSMQLFATESHKAQADQLIITARIDSDARSFASAINGNRTSRETIADLLVSRGISASNIVYKPFSFATETGFLSRKVHTYTVTSRLQISVTTEAQFADVIGVIESRPDEWKFVSFDVHDSREKEHRKQALSAAIAQLKQRQTLVENEFGFKLMAVSFQEVSPGRRSYGYGIAERAPVMASVSSSSKRSSSSYKKRFNSSFGQLHYEAQVAAKYQVKRLD